MTTRHTRARATSMLGLLGLAVTLSACARPYQPTPPSDVFAGSVSRLIPMLEVRAPHDLNCPAEEIAYKNLGPMTAGVDGCGNRATYKWVPETGWVMDAAAHAEPPAGT